MTGDPSTSPVHNTPDQIKHNVAGETSEVDLAFLARDIANLAEQSPSSTSPDAYRLGRVVLGSSGEVTYIIEPNSEAVNDNGITAYFVNTHDDIAGLNNISILDADRNINPYYDYASTYTRRNFDGVVDTDIQRFFEHVNTYGLDKSDTTVRIVNDSVVSRAKLTELQFTRTLTSAPQELVAQYEKAQVALSTHATTATARKITTIGRNDELGILVQRAAEPEVIKELPTKPLAECTVDDLKDLSEKQLAELLVDASGYGDRTFSLYKGSARVWYYFKIAKPDESAYRIDETNFTVTEESNDDDEVEDPPRKITIHLPFIRYGSFRDFAAALPVINEALATLDVPALNEYADFYRSLTEQFGQYWSSDQSRLLHEHNYGDGGLFLVFETAESALAQEISDLQEIGFDFDDIANKLDAVVADLHQAIWHDHDSTRANDGDYELIEKHEEGLPAQYYYANKADPSINASTLIWKYNVIGIPFKGVVPSTLDHRVGHSGHPGWEIPISETSLSLYRHRIIEGYYLPHYRISAARTVWALQMGSPEQQAKALALDWKHAAARLQRVAANRDRTGINTVMNYMIRYFPRDDTAWKEHGFAGYQYQGKAYPTLRDMLVDAKAMYEHIQYPEGAIMIGSQTRLDEIDGTQ